MRFRLLVCCQAFFLCSLTGNVRADGGYVVETDAQVAREDHNLHQGKGDSTGYAFFQKVPDMAFSFRKRVLHPGASIGYHLQNEDEIYYILAGTGTMTIDGKDFPAHAGDAFLTRKGSSHGLVQSGSEDLSLVITFTLPQPQKQVEQSVVAHP